MTLIALEILQKFRFMLNAECRSKLFFIIRIHNLWLFLFRLRLRCLSCLIARLNICRDNLELMKSRLCLPHKLGNESHRVEWNEFQGTWAYFTHCRCQATSVLLIHYDSIDTDEHGWSQNAAEVLWVSHLIQEQEKLSRLFLRVPHCWDISNPLNLSIIELRAFQHNILMRSAHCEIRKFWLNDIECNFIPYSRISSWYHNSLTWKWFALTVGLTISLLTSQWYSNTTSGTLSFMRSS